MSLRIDPRSSEPIFAQLVYQVKRAVGFPDTVFTRVGEILGRPALD